MDHARAPYDLRSRLEGLRAPVRVGIVGMGAMGRGLLHQARLTPGIACLAVADLEGERALAAARDEGEHAELVRDEAELRAAVARGALAVAERGELVARAGCLDVFIEASSAVTAGGDHALAALESGAHVVMMNAEADLAFGPYLNLVAGQRGLVYSSCDGDQYGVLTRLAADLRLWGFELVLAGNVKGFLDRYATPESIAAEADQRHLDHRMCASYTDGTKLCVEMALLANALGLRTEVPGMRGPRAGQVGEALHRFDLGATRRTGPAVDYLLGAEPGGSVFAVGFCEHPYQRRMMAYYKMGDGPYYVFCRPYHLCHVEGMATVAEVALDRRPLLQPWCGLRTDVIAYAKRDLSPGERLDGIGGFACYGLIENRTGDAAEGLPICLADGARVTRRVARDERLALRDVTLGHDDRGFELRRLALGAGPSAA